MKKPQINVDAPTRESLTAIRDTLGIITGQVGGVIRNVKGIVVPTNATGVDVAAASGTQVVTTAEFDLLVAQVADLVAVVEALIDRLNTP